MYRGQTFQVVHKLEVMKLLQWAVLQLTYSPEDGTLPGVFSGLRRDAHQVPSSVPGPEVGLPSFLI